MVANCEVHYAVLPRLERHGQLINVVERKNYGNFIEDPLKFLDKLAYTQMARRIAGDTDTISEDDKLDIITEYAERAGLAVPQFINVLSVYYTRKYQTDVLDFSDMMMFPLLLMAFNRTMLPVIWDRFSYFSMDEAQDADGVQMALCFMCDKDTYKRFTGE